MSTTRTPTRTPPTVVPREVPFPGTVSDPFNNWYDVLSNIYSRATNFRPSESGLRQISTLPSGVPLNPTTSLMRKVPDSNGSLLIQRRPSNGQNGFHVFLDPTQLPNAAPENSPLVPIISSFFQPEFMHSKVILFLHPINSSGFVPTRTHLRFAYDTLNAWFNFAHSSTQIPPAITIASNYERVIIPHLHSQNLSRSVPATSCIVLHKHIIGIYTDRYEWSQCRPATISLLEAVHQPASPDIFLQEVFSNFSDMTPINSTSPTPGTPAPSPFTGNANLINTSPHVLRISTPALSQPHPNVVALPLPADSEITIFSRPEPAPANGAHPLRRVKTITFPGIGAPTETVDPLFLSPTPPPAVVTTPAS